MICFSRAWTRIIQPFKLRARLRSGHSRVTENVSCFYSPGSERKPDNNSYLAKR